MKLAYIERYRQQMNVPGIRAAGQARLLASRALIIGMGGLGSPAALYLAAAGIGTLVISDFDCVEESNLQRQIIYRQADIGELKTQCAQRALLALNPDCHVETRGWQLEDAELTTEVNLADVVLDCSDNFATRFAINKACFAQRKPLVSGAAIRREGQIISLIPGHGPCYECLYPSGLINEEPCALEGVLGPLVGVMGSLQALHAIQILTGQGVALAGMLWLFDSAIWQWRRLTVPKDPACPTCNAY